MLTRQFIQSVLGLFFLVSSSLALSNTEFTYNVIDGGIEVTGCADICPSDLVIPSEYDGFPIVKIGFEAFEDNQLTSLTILDGVVSIGAEAFEDNQITDVFFPNSLTTIGEFAFDDNQLTSITIPDNITQLGAGAFASNLLTNVTIGKGISKIYEWTFELNKLVTVTIPQNIVSIEEEAFYNNQLTTVVFLGHRPDINPTAFNPNINLATISYCSDALGWPGDAIEGITAQLDETCDSDDDGVINTQDASPFDSTVWSEEAVEFTYNVIDGGIEVTGCVGTCPSDLVIPEEIDGYSVTQVGYFAFEKQQMRSVIIPNSVIIIDSGAFKDNLLESVIFSTNITTIRYGAFKHNQLASVTIPNGLVIIEDESFADNKLVTLEIHDKVSIVDYGAFRDNQLSSITFLGEPPSIHSDSFSNNPLTTITYCQNDHEQWDGVIIEGITPQLDENCGDSNNHGEDHGDDEHEEEHHGEYCALHSDEHGDEDGHEEEHEEEHEHDGHCYSPLDLDQNGSFEALTDALILLRYAFGLRGDNLINGAIATDANRTSAEDIEAHIQSLLP